MAIHKGTELNNVNETWNQNERLRQNNESSPAENRETPAANDELSQTIKEEAAEYDKANKDERTLGGERATVNDDDAS